MRSDVLFADAANLHFVLEFALGLVGEFEGVRVDLFGEQLVGEVVEGLVDVDGAETAQSDQLEVKVGDTRL